MSGVIAARGQRVTEKRIALRTRTFTGVAPEDVLQVLRSEHFTGRVTFDMSQGGCSTVQAEDRAQMPYLTPGNNSG